MKTSISILLLSGIALIGSGCVSRTVTIEPEHRGGSSVKKKGKAYGSDPQSKLVEKKIVWIWQKEYRETR